MTGFEAYLLARAYTNKAIEGGGSLKGAACQIKSIEPITGGNRVTFEWEDNQGVVSTDTMDVMNGQDGSDGTDGVGIVSITYKSEDAQGNYIYTVALSDSTSYDITCPKGAKGDTGATGATGADGQDGADGVGITSITKTGTSGLVDTYTITYTNGTTSTFTVTNGSGADLTAGQYIDIDNDEISVKRDIARDVDAIITTSFAYPECTVTKTIEEEVVDTVTFSIFGDIPSSVMGVYSVSFNGQAVALTFTNTVASKEHSVGYAFTVASYSSGVIDTQTFVETLDADKKLIIKSELDAAINAIKDGQNIDSFADVETALGEKADTDIVASDFSTSASYTAGNYCIYEGKFYKFKNNHSGAWAAADVDEIKIAGELSSLMSGLTNIGSSTDLGNVQGSDTITLSDAVSNYRFVQILIGYYGSGYPCFGQVLLPVSTLFIGADDIPLTVAFTDIDATSPGRANISFLSATSVKVVNTSNTVYTKIVGIA